ncbi:MAG: response regulator [Anaerolineales bacterium]|nr:response regulator [Anaerolineales bacterium]
MTPQIESSAARFAAAGREPGRYGGKDGAAPLRAKFRVLLVDDDINYSSLVNDVLGFAENFTLDRAANLREMWALLEKNVYDALLLDYSFPDGSGLDALRTLAQQKREFPVIIVTGRGDERVAAQAIQQGATDYLVKSPETVFELPVIINKAVRNYANQIERVRSLEKIHYQALLLENVRDAVVVWDAEGIVTYWNPAAERLYGWTASQMIGRGVNEVYAGIFSPPPIPVSADSNAPLEVERSVRTNRGETLWIGSRITELRDEYRGGSLLGFIDVTRDITARRRAEEQIRAAQSSLVESARLTAIGELASGVAHQINNPLTAIIAEAQLLGRRLAEDSAARESAAIIEQAGWKAQQAVQDLMDFSRADPDTLESVSVNETIRKAVRMVGAPIQAGGGGLEIDLAEDLPAVRGYPTRLEDLWVNLLLLARDAAADGRAHRIRIRSAARGEGAVTVEVEDDGRAIPAEELDSLFEPHFTGAVAGRGNGMEFSICREIVRQHGGQIRATSSADCGTIVAVELPTEVGNGSGEHPGH